MKYRLNETWVNDDTINVLPVGAVALTDEEWRGRQSGPYLPTALEIATSESFAAKLELTSIDLQSIRSIREYLATRSDAPSIIKGLEIQAASARFKVRG